MSEAQDFHRFVIGEIRIDGWKSDWRREQEERRKNQTYRPKAVPVAKTVRPRKEIKLRVSRAHLQKICPLCSAKMNKNTYGICWRCVEKYRHFIHQPDRRICDEPGCMTTMRVDCKWPKCRKHSAPIRAKHDWQMRKQKNARAA